MVVPAPPRRSREILPVTLTKDGRLADRVQLERVAKAAGSATDCFLFCQGWLDDQAEAHEKSVRFFALLDGVLAPLRERIVPLRLGLHWPSKPFADGPLTRDARATGLWPELEHRFAARSPDAQAALTLHCSGTSVGWKSRGAPRRRRSWTRSYGS
jgi:hypothetical protein